MLSTTKKTIEIGGRPISIGVGLNAGQVFIGNVGGEEKRQFTVLGTPVNRAARFESETKSLDAPIVMGQAFYERLLPDLQHCLMKHENRLIKGPTFIDVATLVVQAPLFLSTFCVVY